MNIVAAPIPPIVYVAALSSTARAQDLKLIGEAGGEQPQIRRKFP